MLLTRTVLASTATLPRTKVSEAELLPWPVRTVRRRTAAWSWTALATLTLAVLFIHGYHPFAEDGGLYVAGVEWKLNPSLFPHLTDFVSEHLSFSIFAPVVASLTRVTHLPLLIVLLGIDFISITLTLAAARALLRRVTPNQPAQLAGIAILAAVWTVPIAGTSLLLMDPYVTARSLSTPLSLWAIAFALDDWVDAPRSLAGCILTIALAAAFHPLMAGYALGLILVLRILRSRMRIFLLTAAAILIFAAIAIAQFHAQPDSPAVTLAAESRYYWFLSQWHWYELFGLVGPILVLLLLRYNKRLGLRQNRTILCDSAILYGCFAAAVATVFAHQGYQVHLVARLQPLRAFLMIYIVMFLLLGTSMQQLCEYISTSSARHYVRYAMVAILLVTGLGMFLAQRHEFRSSAHIELPWQLRESPNPWIRAFLWCRENTPQNAMFALDANYIMLPGEDAQSFRAIARRSVLPDFSKDGGESAITPRLADEWVAGFTAQLHLDQQTASELRQHLAPYGVNWVLLRSDSPAALDCPWHQDALKVCKLQP